MLGKKTNKNTDTVPQNTIEEPSLPQKPSGAGFGQIPEATQPVTPEQSPLDQGQSPSETPQVTTPPAE